MLARKNTSLGSLNELYLLENCVQNLHVQAMVREYSSSGLDAFDLAILRLLQQDCTLPQRQIGEAVNLSTASVQRRVKKMESNGTISAQTAQIDPNAVGLPLTIVVEVELRAETSGRIDETKRSFQEAPEIQQCYYVTGEVDRKSVV